MRLIDADELKIDYGFTWDDITPTHEEMYALIDRQPTVQPERKKGKWLPDARTFQAMFVCSNCMTLMSVDTVNYKPAWNYCPHCGADMRGEHDG